MGPQGPAGAGVTAFAEVDADDGFIWPGSSYNVATGFGHVFKPGPGLYCIRGEALPFNPVNGQVSAINFPTQVGTPGPIAQIFVPGKEPSLVFYNPCGAAVEFPVFVSMWDQTTLSYVDHDFYLTLYAQPG